MLFVVATHKWHCVLRSDREKQGTSKGPERKRQQNAPSCDKIPRTIYSTDIGHSWRIVMAGCRKACSIAARTIVFLGQRCGNDDGLEALSSYAMLHSKLLRSKD